MKRKTRFIVRLILIGYLQLQGPHCTTSPRTVHTSRYKTTYLGTKFFKQFLVCIHSDTSSGQNFPRAFGACLREEGKNPRNSVRSERVFRFNQIPIALQPLYQRSRYFRGDNTHFEKHCYIGGYFRVLPRAYRCQLSFAYRFR